MGGNQGKRIWRLAQVEELQAALLGRGPFAVLSHFSIQPLKLKWNRQDMSSSLRISASNSGAVAPAGGQTYQNVFHHRCEDDGVFLAPA